MDAKLRNNLLLAFAAAAALVVVLVFGMGTNLAFFVQRPSVTIAIAYGNEGSPLPLIHALQKSNLDFDVQLYLTTGYDLDGIHNAASAYKNVVGFGAPQASTVSELLEMAAARSQRDYVVLVQPNVILTAEWVVQATKRLQDKSVGIVGCQVDGGPMSMHPSYTLSPNLTLTAATSQSQFVIPSAHCIAMRRTTARVAVSAMPQMLSALEVARASGVQGGATTPNNLAGLQSLLMTRVLAVTDVASEVLSQVELSDLSTDEYRQIIGDSTNVVIGARGLLKNFVPDQKPQVKDALMETTRKYIGKVSNHRMVKLRAAAEILTELTRLVRAEIYEVEEAMTVLTLATYYTTSTRPVVLAKPVLSRDAFNFATQYELASRYEKHFRGASLQGVAPYFKAAATIMSTSIATGPATMAGSRIPRMLFFVALESSAPDLARDLRASTQQAHVKWMRTQAGFEAKVVRDAECVELATQYRRTAALFKTMGLRPAREHLCRLLYMFRHGGYFVAPGAISNSARAMDWTHSPSAIFTARSLTGEFLPPSLAFGAVPNNPCVKRVLNSAIDVYARHFGTTQSVIDDKFKAVLAGELDADAISKCLASVGGTAVELPSHTVRWPAEVVRSLWEADVAAETASPIPPTFLTVSWADRVPKEAPANRSSWVNELGDSWSFGYFTRTQCEDVARIRMVHRLFDAMMNESSPYAVDAALVCAALACSLDGALTAHWSTSVDDTIDADIHPGAASVVISVDGEGTPTHDVLGCRASHPDVLAALREAEASVGTATPTRFATELGKRVRGQGGTLEIPITQKKLKRMSTGVRTAATSTIPFRVLTTVANSLSRQSHEMISPWLSGQPGFSLHVVKDQDCERLGRNRREVSKTPEPSWSRNSQPGQRSEYCRLLALYAYGGVYIDSDVFVVAPLAEVLNTAKGGAVLFLENPVSEGQQTYVTWIIAAAPGHPMIEKVLQSYEYMGTVGPHAFSAALPWNVDSLVTWFNLADIPVAYHVQASVRWVHTAEYHSVESKQRHDAFLQRWGNRLVYVPFQRHERPLLLRNEIHRLDVDGVPQLILSRHDCLHSARQVGNVTTTIAMWLVLPYIFQNIFCSAARVAESPDLVWGMSMDARIRVVGHLGMALRPIQASSMVLPDLKGGFSPMVMGLTKLCAKELALALEARVVEAIKRYQDLYKPIRDLNVFYATPQGLEWLGVTSPEFETLVRSLDSCTTNMHTLDPKNFWENMAMTTMEDTPHAMIRSLRHVIQPHAVPSYATIELETKFAYDNPEVVTVYHSLQSCTDDGKEIWSLGGVDLRNVPFEASRRMCALFYLHRDGGFVTTARALSYLPMVMWFDASLPFVAVSVDGKRSLDFVGSKPEHPCLKRALVFAMGHARDAIENGEVQSLAKRLKNVFSECPNPKTEYGFGMDELEQPRLGAASSRAVIPRRAFTTWKTHDLFDEAAKLDRQWRVEEPTVERRVVNDSECRYLAARFSGMPDVFEAFPINVMRADTCRLLTIYYYGGIYMDLDVAWVRPLDEWFDWGADIVVGNETEGHTIHVCNWFFAATPKHRCIETALLLVQERWRALRDNLDKQPHFVHLITGPAMFTEAISRCGARTSLTREDVGRDKIFHQYGSQIWKNNPKYESWIQRREKLNK